MKSDVSALMDGAQETAPAQTLFDRLGRDRDLRDAWSRYHLIGDVLRGSTYGGMDVTRRVMDQLADEPTVLFPRRRPRSMERNRWSRYLMPLAASVMGISAVGWVAQTLNSPSMPLVAAVKPPTTVAQRADRQSAPPVMPTDAIEPADVSQVRHYLFAHQGYSLESSFQGIPPYVRTVSDERGGRVR